MTEIKQTATYQKWYRKLKDRKASLLIANRIERLVYGLAGYVSSVGDGVSELRIHYGPGYRVYFTRQGNEIIVLLCGGNKTSQQRDIQQAKQILKELR